jgi:hypothetical protein
MHRIENLHFKISACQPIDFVLPDINCHSPGKLVYVPHEKVDDSTMGSGSTGKFWNLSNTAAIQRKSSFMLLLVALAYRFGLGTRKRYMHKQQFNQT